MSNGNQVFQASNSGASLVPTKGKSVAAIVGFVVGIIALLLSFLPIINNFAFFLALIALVFSIVGLVATIRGTKSGKGMAIAAVIICVLSCAAVLATQSAYSNAIDQAVSNTNPTVSTDTGNAASQSTEQTASSAADFTIADETLQKDTYSATITGSLTNNTSTDKSYVGVTYNLYDASGSLIGNAYANANGLKAGSTWKFEAYCTVSDPSAIATFDRGDVTTW